MKMNEIQLQLLLGPNPDFSTQPFCPKQASTASLSTVSAQLADALKFERD